MLSSCSFSTKLERIAQLAREAPDMSFTSLSHYLDIGLLKEAFRRTRKNGSPGVDGQTALTMGSVWKIISIVCLIGLSQVATKLRPYVESIYRKVLGKRPDQ